MAPATALCSVLKALASVSAAFCRAVKSGLTAMVLAPVCADVAVTPFSSVIPVLVAELAAAPLTVNAAWVAAWVCVNPSPGAPETVKALAAPVPAPVNTRWAPAVSCTMLAVTPVLAALIAVAASFKVPPMPIETAALFSTWSDKVPDATGA